MSQKEILIDSKDLSSLMKEGKVFVRSIRFASSLNPYSLHNETNVQTEIRKIKRKKGLPTLVSTKATKDGNLNRSLTLVVPGQKLFGNVGYGLIEPDEADLKYIMGNMNSNATGYGKDKHIGYLEKVGGYNHIRENIRRFSTNATIYDEVNEVIADIKNQDSIKFVYYYNCDNNMRTRDGIETTDLNIKKLDAIYLKEKLIDGFGIDIPIFTYSRWGSVFKDCSYSNEDILNGLKSILVSKKEFVDRIELFMHFKKHIKTDGELENTIKRALMASKYKITSELYYKGIWHGSDDVGSFVNKRHFYIKSMINYAKCLDVYDLKEISKEVKEKALKDLLTEYNNLGSKIYKKKDGCSHTDLHIRNFVERIDEIKEIISEDKFIEYLPKIRVTFKNICESNHSNRLLKEQIKVYSEKKDYLRDIHKDIDQVGFKKKESIFKACFGLR